MTHLKCSQCGLNNCQGAEICERCGASLNHHQPEPVITRPDVPAPARQVFAPALGGQECFLQDAGGQYQIRYWNGSEVSI